MAATHSFDVLVLGGGAAGLMCAIETGKRGQRTAVVEHADRLGKKILISGGGRCNFTNIHCGSENFLSSNPHFAKSALARYTPQDFIALVEKYRIPYHEKTLGQLFCDHSSRDILAMLEEECRIAGVRIFLNTTVQQVRRAGQFVVESTGAEFHAPALVVATGGLSIPKIGATSFGYDLARQFGLKIREPRPGLVPFVLSPEDQSRYSDLLKIREPRPGLVPFVLSPEDQSRYSDLAGVSLDVMASVDGQAFREKMLVTHRGLSGPAILQISSYWESKKRLQIDLAPETNLTSAFLHANTPRSDANLRSEFRKILPSRFADRWLELNPPESWTNPALVSFEKHLHNWTITPAGTEGFEKAEVTAGGVDTDELSAKTMESRKVPGLYFIGEVVDVTGQLGGFNFQWAWASGAAAGRAI